MAKRRTAAVLLTLLLGLMPALLLGRESPSTDDVPASAVPAALDSPPADRASATR